MLGKVLLEYYCSHHNGYHFVFPMVIGLWSYAGLQARFRTFGTGFICGSAIGYYST
jgi:hypothetical protein